VNCCECIGGDFSVDVLYVQYAVAEVFDEEMNELMVFPVASVWVSNLQTSFTEEGKSILKGTIHWPKDEANVMKMLMKRPKPDNNSGKWVHREGSILKFTCK